MDKNELRSRIRERKRAMTDTQIWEKSLELSQKLFETESYRRAKTVYGYLSYNQEVRTLLILEQALRDGKRVAVPKVCGQSLRFVYIEDFSAVERGYRGIPEPVADGPVADDRQALVLLPGLAFDPDGRRVGYGGGFYDRFLASEPGHPTVALCYDFQMLPKLETEDFDVAADLVLWA